MAGVGISFAIAIAYWSVNTVFEQIGEKGFLSTIAGFLAQALYAKGEYARATEQFEGLIARFPYGNKAPDALLKLGLCQEKTGAHEQAQKTFAELQDRYPKSEAVRQIPRP